MTQIAHHTLFPHGSEPSVKRNCFNEITRSHFKYSKKMITVAYIFSKIHPRLIRDLIFVGSKDAVVLDLEKKISKIIPTI